MILEVNKKTNAEAALIYASAGLPVFPLHTPVSKGICSCGNTTCKSIGKHPRSKNGVKDATHDPEAVKRIWTKYPTANIGIACGDEAGICVIDIDPIHGGNESLAILEKTHGNLPDTLRSRTGSGGQHIFFKYNGESYKNCNRGEIGAGIDFKTEGGYVVAAPSMHLSGHKYQWISNDTDKIADLPEYIKQLVTKKVLSQVERAHTVNLDRNEIPDGQRNITLFSLACSLRQKKLAPASILAAALTENENKCNPPLDVTEVESIVSSACKYESSSSMKNFNLTDVGNAQRMAKRYPGHFKYCSVWKKFLIWDNCRYIADDTGCIERMAKETVRNILNEASSVTDDSDCKKLAKHALASENHQRLKSMVILTQSEEEVAIAPSDLDKNDWVLNCKNGTLDLKTGLLGPHRKDDLITKLVPVPYDSEATCPTWMAFLEKIMGSNKDMINFLQKALGYSLTGSTQEQCIFILHGTGANGKSTLLNTIETMLADYAQQTPTATLMAKKNEGIPNDIARLQGARFVTASEADQGKSFSESLIKQMTGGDKLTARFLHGEFFSFNPKFKIFLATNHRPTIRGTDNGIWRRIRLIPFNVTIPKEEQDPDLMTKLKNELPGIFNWVIKGCLLWQLEGLTPPHEVNAATNEYRADSDWLQAFIASKLIEKKGLKISASVLYAEYKDWVSENGEYEYSQRVFGAKLKDKGYKNKRSGSNGVVEWVGLGKLSENVSEPSFAEATDTTDTSSHIFK